ncbi:hypothetical protein [Symbioplanes lichenis]|uniref:hypothetical protein n=1 Tax=Symbioplanes lichenis TaxID=1629072 RepID=UPI002738221B|nr:hypothetical protein [Actinoplanes lichenis]
MQREPAIELGRVEDPAGPGRLPVRTLVVVAVAGVLVAVLVPLTRRGAPAAAPEARAAVVLRSAATAAEREQSGGPQHRTTRLMTVDVVEYPDGRLVPERTWTVTEQWVPADPYTEWRLRSYDLAAPTLVSDLHGRCGSYYASPGEDPCAAPGDWRAPTARFLGTLPHEPVAMLARLRKAGSDPWENGTAALESGALPAGLIAVVYRALAELPGVLVEARAGRLFVYRESGGARFGVLLDERTLTLTGHERWRAGTLIDSAETAIIIDHEGLRR